MDDDYTIYREENLFAESLSVLREIRRQGRLCDIILRVSFENFNRSTFFSSQQKQLFFFVATTYSGYQVENETFSAHRVILASQIPFFNAMFSQDYAEYSKKEIELKEIDATALEHLINFAYSGSIRIDTANCQSIMIGASFLQLNKVRDACAQFLIQK